MVIKEAGSLEMVFTPKSGAVPIRMPVYDFTSPGVALSMYNVDEVEHINGFLYIVF